MSRNIRILGSEINWYWMDLSLTMSDPNYLMFLCANVLRNHDVRAWCNWTKSLFFSPPDRKNRESLYHFGTIVYQPTWMVELYGKCTYSKYTSPMDAMGLILSHNQSHCSFLKVFNYPAHKRSHMKENFLTPEQTNLTETFHHCWISPSTFKVLFPSSWCQAVPKKNEALNLETKFGDASFIASTNPKTSEKQMFGDPVRIPGSSQDHGRRAIRYLRFTLGLFFLERLDTKTCVTLKRETYGNMARNLTKKTVNTTWIIYYSHSKSLVAIRFSEFIRHRDKSSVQGLAANDLHTTLWHSQLLETFVPTLQKRYAPEV